MNHTKTIPKIKICGIKTCEEAKMLNDVKVDYAGFVFYEKSKRYITIEQYKEIKKVLDEGIKTVAVTVSPDLEMLDKINELDIDILQVHGELRDDVIKKSRHPIWQAINVGQALYEEDNHKIIHLERARIKDREKSTDAKEHLEVAGVVIDGMNYGGGKTFDWNDEALVEKLRERVWNNTFVLAGGLNAQNVNKGIQIFSPDIVDVSSGVENIEGTGKDKEKIKEFVRKVREHE